MAELAGLAKLIPAITGIASGASGLYNSYENSKYQNMLRGYAESPQKFMNYAKGFTQPLTAGLQQGVANSAQGYAAERGLATSPAQEQQVYAQAIAPYIQQQQNQGMQNAYQALGLGGGANPTNGGNQLTSGLEGLTQYLQGLGRQRPGANPQLPNFDPAAPDITNWAGAGGDQGFPDLSAIFSRGGGS